MKRIIRWFGVALVLVLVVALPIARAQQPFTLEQVLSAPFPDDLTAAKTDNRLAWVFNDQGKRNIWVAEVPDVKAHQLTNYTQDDGQEISSVQFSAGASYLVYVRGGSKNHAGESPNPTSNPAGAEQDVWVIAWSGGEPRKIDAGHSPQISVRGTIAYLRDGQIWLAPLDGSEKPKQIVVRGTNSSLKWSPDGLKLAFVSSREDHAFIGIYDTTANTVQFIAPTVDHDSTPEWSPDGAQLAFIRRPAVPRDTPEGYFIAPDRPHPWAIWIADTATSAAKEIWQSGAQMQDSFPYMAEDTGGGVINWAANNTIILASEQDNWQHLYALSAKGGALRLLTPGACEVEEWSLTPDRSTIVFNSNCEDSARRHLWRVRMDGRVPEPVTTGDGIEWSPQVLSDGNTLAYLASDAHMPAKVFLSNVSGTQPGQPLAPETFPTNFPLAALVTPQLVSFNAADGTQIYSEIFLPTDLKSGQKRPAVIFIHGGPMRQMLLGWHYMLYYANAYGMNQYLASRGYIVLAINYRSGVGYGRAFREAPGRAGRGASEYQDLVAAGKYLQSRGDVDPAKIGLWGGSYGGYLTALGLGRNSDIFKAGVDLHGVHDWPTDNWNGKNISPELIKLAHDSSPVTAVDTWKSPVLFIHGDDDRNVYFTQTVDLIARLRPRGVHIEQLIFPDEIHDFLLHSSWLKAYHAASDFFDRELRGESSAPKAAAN
jgi:dipeptidyl aminopeptidase/acylaminoacyl peptidase